MRQRHSNLKRILQLPNLPADYRPLKEPEFFAEGTGNSHWLITSPVGKLVWRQFGTAPGVDHQRETKLLNCLQNKAWVPRLLLIADDLGVLMRLAEGEHPKAAELSSTARQRLINLALELWQNPCPIAPQNYPQLLNSYWQLAGSKTAHQPLLKQLIYESLRWPTRCYRLTHHDLHAGNLLLNNDNWVLLDWEYAALGNPWLDAVSLDRFMHLTQEEKAQLEAVLPPLAVYTNPWRSLGRWLADLDLLWKQALDKN